MCERERERERERVRERERERYLICKLAHEEDVFSVCDTGPRCIES